MIMIFKSIDVLNWFYSAIKHIAHFIHNSRGFLKLWRLHIPFGNKDGIICLKLQSMHVPHF